MDRKIEGVREYATRPEVQVSSMIKTDFDAYRQLVNLGVEALEPLRGLMGKQNQPRWYILCASCEILRKSPSLFQIPEEIRGDLDKMEKYVCDVIDGSKAF
jgi:hypothetical protein